MHFFEMQFNFLFKKNWLILFEVWHTFSKIFQNDFVSFCKSLTEKVMVSFKVELIDVACFIVKFTEIFK